MAVIKDRPIVLRTILRISKPLHLLFAALAYVLGVGVGDYLGIPVSTAVLALGLLWVFSLQFGIYLVSEYFRLVHEPSSPDLTVRRGERLRRLLLQISAAALTMTGVLTVLLLYARLINLLSGLILLLIFMTGVAYAVPPVRLVNRGFGELALATLWAVFYPALGFTLCAGEIHRLLTMVAFPLSCLALSYLLISNFTTFASDQKYNRQTLLIRLTWQRAVPIHHFLLLCAYLLFAVIPFLGVSWRLIWPVFLTMPFAGCQIFALQRITQGGRPYWNILVALAAAVFGLTAYLLSLTLVIR